jgi:hypothetical protein
LARVTEPDASDDTVDLHLAAEHWLQLVTPYRLAIRAERRRSRYSRLTDIDEALRAQPLQLNAAEAAFSDLLLVEPLA